MPKQGRVPAQHVEAEFIEEAVVGATALEDLSWAQALPASLS